MPQADLIWMNGELVAWEDATIAGFALTRTIDEPTRRRLTARIQAMWPPGPHALASAAKATSETSLIGCLLTIGLR